MFKDLFFISLSEVVFASQAILHSLILDFNIGQILALRPPIPIGSLLRDLRFSRLSYTILDHRYTGLWNQLSCRSQLSHTSQSISQLHLVLILDNSIGLMAISYSRILGRLQGRLRRLRFPLSLYRGLCRPLL